MATGDIWRVIGETLHIRVAPGYYSGQIDELVHNEEVVELERATIDGSVWIRHDRGWSHSQYMSKIYSADPVVTTITENSRIPTLEEIEENGYGYQPTAEELQANQNTRITDSEFVKIKNIAGVFGLPYQFLPKTDIRLSGNEDTANIGYEYAEKIIERIPLLFIAPGKASFMSKYSRSNKESIIENLIDSFGSRAGNLNDLLDSDGRYYNFEYDTSRYYTYVNPMCRIAAQYLGIGDMVINGRKLSYMNWQDYTDSGIRSISDFGEFRSIPFYLDTESSISESFSNTTTQSMIASSANSISDMGRELNFLFGYSAGSNIDTILNNPDVMANMENVNNLVKNILGSGSFLSNLTQHLTAVATGGKLIFPEIWSDSQFSRSYNCEIKLVAPDPSKFSVYMNVLVPLFHLIGLVAPHSIKNNPNAYGNPFIVRAIYKGFFNVDMGIITSMHVNKGAECQWTAEGIPTSITVSLEIKDLYSALSITNTEDVLWRYDTLNNTALMDYIANLCGINIYKPEIGRTIQMWLINNGINRAQDLFKTKIWGGIQDSVQNLIMNIYRG